MFGGYAIRPVPLTYSSAVARPPRRRQTGSSWQPWTWHLRVSLQAGSNRGVSVCRQAAGRPDIALRAGRCTTGAARCSRAARGLIR
jgi:hypothetical protein